MRESSVSTVLITKGHALSCVVPTKGQRLLDLLNDPETEFLNVNSIEVYRHASSDLVRAFPASVIRKTSIALAILTGPRHEAPERRKNSYTSKSVYDAFVTIGDFEVNGMLHLMGSPDTLSFLTHEANRFVPLSKANVCFKGASGGRFQERVIIVSKSAIDLLEISERDPAEAETELLTSIREMMDNPAGTQAYDGALDQAGMPEARLDI